MACFPAAYRPRVPPPVVREHFTVLACAGQPRQRTTVLEEGCVEQQILATDGQINAVARSIFSLLGSAARLRFIAAQKAWLNYRRADCNSVSDVFEGGTLAPLLYARCSVDRNAQRVKDLRTFHKQLAGSG
jgi:uncharacterized protein YecT (DUF1311 family)